jgi:hypothetical protein
MRDIMRLRVSLCFVSRASPGSCGLSLHTSSLDSVRIGSRLLCSNRRKAVSSVHFTTISYLNTKFQSFVRQRFFVFFLLVPPVSGTGRNIRFYTTVWIYASLRNYLGWVFSTTSVNEGTVGARDRCTGAQYRVKSSHMKCNMSSNFVFSLLDLGPPRNPEFYFACR